MLKFSKYKNSTDGAEDEFESYEVDKINNVGVAEQMMKLQQLRSLVDERRAIGERSHDQPTTGNGTVESKKAEQQKRNQEAMHFLSKAKEKGVQRAGQARYGRGRESKDHI